MVWFRTPYRTQVNLNPPPPSLLHGVNIGGSGMFASDGSIAGKQHKRGETDCQEVARK
jgi:hypothetical protein